MAKSPDTTAAAPNKCESCDQLKYFPGSWELNPYDYCGITGKIIIQQKRVVNWCPKLPKNSSVRVEKKFTDECLKMLEKLEADAKKQQTVSTPNRSGKMFEYSFRIGYEQGAKDQKEDQKKWMHTLSKKVKPIIQRLEKALDEKQKRIENMEKIIEDQQERIDIMSEGGWISVKDKLPDQRIGVLVYCPEYNNIFAGELNDYLKKDQWYFFDDEIKHPIKDEVTHWMPMPKPPEVGEQE